MKLKRRRDLLLSLGGSNMLFAMRGVSTEGEEEKKKRLKGVTSALSEIWDRAIFQSVPFSIKEENHRGKKDRNTGTFGVVAQKRAYSAFLQADQSVSTVHAQLPRARARVCVYKCLNECHKQGKDGKAKKGGMVDNSSSSKAQMVSRGSGLASLYISVICNVTLTS